MPLENDVSRAGGVSFYWAQVLVVDMHLSRAGLFEEGGWGRPLTAPPPRPASGAFKCIRVAA